MQSRENETIAISGTVKAISQEKEKDKEESNEESDLRRELENKSKTAPVLIVKSLNFIGIGPNPTVKISAEIFSFIAGHNTKKIVVSFSDLHFTEGEEHLMEESKTCTPSSHGLMILKGASVRITNCTLNQLCTGLHVIGFSDGLTEINITDTAVTNVHYTVYSKNMTLINLEMRRTSIIGETDSNVPYYAITLIIRNAAVVNIVDCYFHKVNEAIAVSLHRKWLKMKVSSCIFEENSGQSILLSFAPSVETKKCRIHLDGLTFINNDGGFASSVHLIHSWDTKERVFAPSPNILLTKSLFQDNYAQAFFGAIYADGVDLEVKHTNFFNNTAGNEAIAIQAFGGAIFVEARTSVEVLNCSFENNTCSGFGGAIFSRGSFAALHSRFSGSTHDSVIPLLGDILYATAGLFLENTTWYPGKSRRSKSAIWHPGSPTLEPWHIRIRGHFTVYCPVGHNITGHGIIRKPGMLTDRMSMGCQSCPRNQYSLQSGYLRVQTKEDKVIKRDIVNAHCHWCRYGGVCEDGKIKAKANYYGYMSGKPVEVRFISCPFGYCCQGDECRSYDSCSPLRRGKICGSCVAGTTENLLSAKCSRVENCNDMWFWFIYFPFGFAYIWFFMYLDKISGFFKGQLGWWEQNFVDSKDEKGIDETDENIAGNDSERKESAEKGHPSHDQEVQRPETELCGVVNSGEALEINNANSKDLTLTQNADRSEEKNGDDTFDSNYELEKTEAGTIRHGGAESSANLDNKNGDLENDSLRSDARDDMERQKRTSDPFSDVINITFYFYQMVLIIRDHDNVVLTHTIAMLKAISTSVFTFSLDPESTLSLCPFEGLTPVSKNILVRSFAIYVIVLLILVNLCNNFYNFMAERLCSYRALSHETSFRVRMRVTTIQILLLAYSTITYMIMNLVNCVPINGELVLYMDGTIKCFTWWQVAALLLTIFWLVPFPFALVFGINQLGLNRLTYNQFIASLTFPVCFLCWLAFKGCLRETNKSLEIPRTRSATQMLPSHESEEFSIEEILRRFEAPFKGERTDNGRMCSILIGSQPGFWQGMMILRRLIIIMLFTFVNSPVTRLYCIFLACLLFLMHHLTYLPYKNGMVNLFETFSSATLVVFCSINLFFAYSYVSNVPPESADERISLIFDWIEVIILVIFPLLSILSLFVMFVARCVVLLAKCSFWNEN